MAILVAEAANRIARRMRSMRSTFMRRLAGTATVLIAGTAMALAAPAAQAAPRAATGYTPPSGVTDPCPPTAPGDAGCAALTSKSAASSADRAAARPAAATSTPPAGYSPANLQQAYDSQPTADGSGQTVAVVTAYNDPDAASDLAAYRTQYGLTACTVANGCFKQVSQTGSTTSLPGTSAGWTVPAAQSIDMISAICPNCHILLVEANSSGISDLGTAENEAVTLGAKFIDNDWVIPEAQLGTAETSYDSEYFDHPGVAITAPAGDSGYGVINYPAASPYVIAVGGTTLTADSSVLPRGYTETAWTGTSSGCSAYEPKPSWQTDTGCADRTLNDTAADADASTPVAYYDIPTEGGWGEGSGATVAAAIIAAAYALVGTPASGTSPASLLYANTGNLNDITSGSDGTCAVSYLCTAGTGYDGPTGNGTPSPAFFPPGTSAPVLYYPATSSLETFATSSSGNLGEEHYKAGVGWSGWLNLGGSITGKPAAIVDAITGNLEVYATGTNHQLEEISYSPTTGWTSGWQSLGGSITGSPAVINDPITGNLEVYATGTNGQLEEIWYSPTGHWDPGGWQTHAGSITGSPAVATNWGSNNLEVYAIGADDSFEETWYNLTTHWYSGGWESHGGSFTAV
jgi:subtilase family serine protease